LVLGSVVASHELIALIGHDGGLGSTLPTQEREHGRDWVGVALTIAVVAIALALVAFGQLHRLMRQGSMGRRRRLSVDDGGVRVFGRVIARFWLPLVAATSAALLVHENFETASAGLPLPGLRVLGGDHVIAVPTIAVVSLVVAVVAALVCLGRHVLLVRRTRGLTQVRHPRSAPTVRRVSSFRPRSLVAVMSHGLRAPPSISSDFA
jgi:hypothetical protein